MEAALPFVTRPQMNGDPVPIDEVALFMTTHYQAAHRNFSLDSYVHRIETCKKFFS